MTRIERLVLGFTHRGLLDVLERAAVEHFVPREAILERCRLQSVVAARRAVCIALRERGMSYPEIGRLIDRDHTSVMNLVRDEGRKKLPATIKPAKVRHRSRPRCACGSIYEDHLSQPPHRLPARECPGFVLQTAKAG